MKILFFILISSSVFAKDCHVKARRVLLAEKILHTLTDISEKKSSCKKNPQIEELQKDAKLIYESALKNEEMCPEIAVKPTDTDAQRFYDEKLKNVDVYTVSMERLCEENLSYIQKFKK